MSIPAPWLMWQPRCGWVWDEGPGVQVASAPRLSTEQDLGCTAITAQYGAGFEAQGWGHGAAWHGHHSNLIVLGLGNLIQSLKCQDFIRQPSIHSLNPPCGCSGTQGPVSLVGLVALPMAQMPVVRSTPCRAPSRELPPLLSHHSVFYFACRSRRWPSDVSASRPFSWLLEMVDGLSL